MKKTTRFLLTCSLPIVAIILECLPSGAVLHMANGPHDVMIHTYPYFSLTPFGYANFGPLITAVLTVVLLILGAIYLLNGKKALFAAHKWTALAAFLASLLPVIMFGIKSTTDVGGIITLVLFVQTVICFLAPSIKKMINQMKRKS